MKYPRPPAKLYLLLFSLSAPHFVLAGQQEAENAQVATTRLFVANCAPCHGETGDGKGTTVLDRPARSFRDGGFSYGNTLDALYRSITSGIPGTPMPSFEAAIPEADRRALAAYVLGLGPPDMIGDTPDKVLVVGEIARVARGKLPPIAEGTTLQPRGLLLGLPSGLSFEYRVDDVRLLGVRQGQFVERRDWVGRGGDVLQPLGQLLHTYGAGNPRPPFLELVARDPNQPFGLPSGEERELVSELKSTWVRAAAAGILTEVRRAGGPLCLAVEEELESLNTSVGSGWSRRFSYRGLQARARLVHRFADDDAPELRQAAFAQAAPALSASGPRQWQITQRSQGGFEARGLCTPPANRLIRSASVSALWLDVAPGATAEVEVVTLFLPTWSAEIQEKLLRELPLQ